MINIKKRAKSTQSNKRKIYSIFFTFSSNLLLAPSHHDLLVSRELFLFKDEIATCQEKIFGFKSYERMAFK